MLNRAPRLSAWLERHRPLLVPAALVLLWLGVSTSLALLYSGRIRDWSVMTDELLYAKLATAIAETGSPLPEVHGTSIAVYSQLYPLVLAPFYGTLDPPEAFRSAHVLNAFLMASAAFPAYLLGRQVLSRVWSFGVAALAVLVPWMVLTGFLMTEAVAYPAFLWALLGLQLAIAAPSPRRDLLAVAGLGLALLARTQFAVLVLVLPLAILGHEFGQALAAPGPDSIWRKLLAGPWEAVRRHPVLALLYAAGAVVAAVVAVADSFGRLLGVYAVTVEGSILPSGVLSAAARHLDAVAIGCGLVPLLLGGGWMLATVVRPHARKVHALATLSLVTVVLLTFEAASFGVRFGDDVVRDRYLFYAVPLLLIGAAAAVATGPRRPVAVGTVLLTIFFAATAAQLPFTTFSGVWVDSPASVLNDLLIEQSASLGTGTFVALLGLLVGLVLALALLLAPRMPFALVLFASLLVFSLLTLRSEVDRVVDGTGLSGRPLAGEPGLELDWVDGVVPTGAEAALIAFPVSTAWDTTAIRWWDVEFWNRSIGQAYVAPDGNFRYTPFPQRTLQIDWETGDIPGTDDAPEFVVAAPSDSRLLLAGRDHALNLGFVVRAVDRPYRALWASRGLEADGWSRPGQPATVRIYDRRSDRSERRVVGITVRAPSAASARYRITSGGETRTGTLAADEERTEAVPICTPPGAPADVTLIGWSDARVEGVQLSPDVTARRHVGVLVGPISVRRAGVSERC